VLWGGNVVSLLKGIPWEGFEGGGWVKGWVK